MLINTHGINVLSYENEQSEPKMENSPGIRGLKLLIARCDIYGYRCIYI